MVNQQNFDIDDESDLQEQINLLQNEGYRGFTVTLDAAKWNRREVVVKDSTGVSLKAHGDTPEEAYAKAIDMIDYSLDDTI